MATLLNDLHFGLRTLRKQPTFSLVVIVTLGLAFGANSAVFSVIHGVLLQPLPYSNGARIVVLEQRTPGGAQETIAFSAKEIEDYRKGSRLLREIVEYHSRNFVVWGRLEPHQVDAGVVSANYFKALGLEPILGRTFMEREDQPGSKPILVLSHEYWLSRFNGDANVIGRNVRMDDKIHEIVGVLPPVPEYPRHNDVYVPISHCPMRSNPGFIADRSRRMMSTLGLLVPTATLQQAQAELDAIAHGIAAEHPAFYPREWEFTASASFLSDVLSRDVRPTLFFLVATASLVLLIGCANVISLSLSRGLARRQEIALRAALGAGRRRLLQQTMTESTLLALAGGACGMLITWWSMHILVDFVARSTPRAVEIALDQNVFLFTLILSLLTGLVVGCLPGLGGEKAMTRLLAGGRSSENAGTHRLRQYLVVVQIASAVVLLTAFGFMTRSLIQLTQLDAGVDSENVLTMRIGLNYAKYRQSEEGVGPARMAYMQDAVSRARAIPGVLSAGLVSLVPLSEQASHEHYLSIEGRSADQNPALAVTHNSADPGYFETVGIRLIKGRNFRPGDDHQAPQVAILTRSTARRHWPNQDPIGKRIALHEGDSWMEVIGIVGDIRQHGLDEKPSDQVFVPFGQAPFASRLVVRFAGKPEHVTSSLIRGIREIDPEQTLDSVITLEELRRQAAAPRRLVTKLIGLLSLLALVITSTGIAGLAAMTVSRRGREIGIRRALGANAPDILSLVLGQSLRLTLLGGLLGIGAGTLLGRLLEDRLYQTSAGDPLTLGSVGLAILIVTLLASWIPAQRALRIDPREAVSSH